MIGDVIASNVICEYLKKVDKCCEIHFLANSNTIDVLLNNPYIDKIIDYDKNISLREFKRFIKSIQSHQYDVVIDAYCKIRSNLISLLSNAPERISYYKWYSSFFYTKTIHRRKESQTIASCAIENRLLLVNDSKNINHEMIKPKIFLKNSEIKHAKNILEKYDLFEKPPIMLSILGSSRLRSYPLEYMARVIDYLSLVTDDNFILNFIPNQINHVNQILSLISSQAKQRIFIEPYGKSIREFLSLLYWCKAIIGNEGGATNMAKAINIPTFSINSPWINKDGWNMFEDGKVHTSIHLQDYKPELFENKSAKKLKKSAIELYEAFTPDLIYGKLKLFCDLNTKSLKFDRKLKLRI